MRGTTIALRAVLIALLGMPLLGTVLVAPGGPAEATDGRTRKQGSGTTPLGTYTMTEAFGNGPAPGMWLPYHRVRSGDYWVGDPDSRYYNSLRNKANGGFRWWLPSSSSSSSERLQSFPHQYRYVVVINFNRARTSRSRTAATGSSCT
jgi:L,D-peptidoglycan transpeptidase YkuD (ErfK/YbiS/YcfS/YnhG family)